MFRLLNKQGVESDRRFAVQVIDRFTIEYRENNRKINVYAEPGMGNAGQPCSIIDPGTFRRWDGGAKELSPEKQAEMLLNFTEAMTVLGLQVVVENAEN